jgi:hypothetical protein
MTNMTLETLRVLAQLLIAADPGCPYPGTIEQQMIADAWDTVLDSVFDEIDERVSASSHPLELED